MDDADRAKVLEIAQRENALKRQLAAAEADEDQLHLNGVVVCVDCLDPIGAERLRVYPEAVRCISCQQDHEHQVRR